MDSNSSKILYIVLPLVLAFITAVLLEFVKGSVTRFIDRRKATTAKREKVEQTQLELLKIEEDTEQVFIKALIERGRQLEQTGDQLREQIHEGLRQDNARLRVENMQLREALHSALLVARLVKTDAPKALQAAQAIEDKLIEEGIIDSDERQGPT